MGSIFLSLCSSLGPWTYGHAGAVIFFPCRNLSVSYMILLKNRKIQ